MNRFSGFQSWAYVLLLVLVACSTGHCRRDGNEVIEKVNPKPPAGYEEENLGSIRVGKPDGSQQCGYRAGKSLEKMAADDLKGVEILASEKQHDGLMRIQRCGEETGMLNTYTIRHQDLRQAQKAGFSLFKTETPEN